MNILNLVIKIASTMLTKMIKLLVNYWYITVPVIIFAVWYYNKKKQ